MPNFFQWAFSEIVLQIWNQHKIMNILVPMLTYFRRGKILLEAAFIFIYIYTICEIHKTKAVNKEIRKNVFIILVLELPSLFKMSEWCLNFYLPPRILCKMKTVSPARDLCQPRHSPSPFHHVEEKRGRVGDQEEMTVQQLPAMPTTPASVATKQEVEKRPAAYPDMPMPPSVL